MKVKLTLWIDDDVIKSAKKTCVDEGESLSQIVEECLKKFVAVTN